MLFLLFKQRIILSWLKIGGLLSLFLVIETFSLAAFARTKEVSHKDNQYLCPADLPTIIESIIHRPDEVHSRWGILIKTLSSGQTLYSLDADKYFIPASNVKLLTTAAALQELGANFLIQTPVYTTGKPPKLTELRLQGRGDPTISFNTLKNIAQQLKKQGVDQIEKLIVDDSYFSSPRINPSWEWSDLYSYYGTSVNSLIINENTFTLTLLPQEIGESVKLQWSDYLAFRQWKIKNQGITASPGKPYTIEVDGILGEPVLQIRGELAFDSEPDIWDLAIADPPSYFLESFRQILLTEGINVTQGLVVNQSLKQKLSQKFTSITSPPLKVLIAETNQESNNLFAESLLQILGKQLKTDTGLDAVTNSLTKLGIAPESYILVDGSGLSRHNLITPEALVKTLRLMAQASTGKIYRKSLAVAGVSGTLKKRFTNTTIQGNLQGKTGTLSGIAALSGYFNVPNYQPLVFSIMVNNSPQSSENLRQLIDEIILVMGKIYRC